MHEELKNIISDGMKERYESEQKFIERAWEDDTFKQELLNNPKAVFERELGQEIPKYLEIEVLQETANKIYLVLPENPASTEGELSEEALETVAGGTCVEHSHAYNKKRKWGTIGNCSSAASGLV